MLTPKQLTLGAMTVIICHHRRSLLEFHLTSKQLFGQVPRVAKKSRKKPSKAAEESALAKSARRCALCFALKGDLREKIGQIAHIDGNRANSVPGNLAWMCLEHHSSFDSITSQHKNYTKAEVKRYLAALYRIVADGKHLSISASPQFGRGVSADRKILESISDLMVESGSIEFVRRNNFAGWSFDWSSLRGIEEFAARGGPENEFIDPELEELRKTLHDSCRQLLSILATNTFPIRDRQSVPDDWETDQPERFWKVVSEIDAMTDKVCCSYDDLIRNARKRLLA
jgi:hypothetical protein